MVFVSKSTALDKDGKIKKGFRMIRFKNGQTRYIMNWFYDEEEKEKKEEPNCKFCFGSSSSAD